MRAAWKRIAGWGAALVLLGGLLRAQGAQLAPEFEARRAEARAALVGSLEDFAAWCQGKSLFKEKARCYELVLELVPDHAEARKVLGYSRAKDGRWTAPEKPKVYRDFDKKALEEAPERWAEATAGFVQAMVRELESGTLGAPERDAAASEALRFDPDNERVHTLLGEVESDKGWVLPETARARERRAVLRELVRSALEGAPPTEAVPLTEREKRFPLHFEAVAAPGLRVVGTVSEDELRLTAQAVLAMERLLGSVFESKYRLPADTTVFLLADPAHFPAFLEHHPAIRPEQRAYFQKLEGGGVQGTNDFAFWTGDTQRRIDGIVRLVLGFWLSGAFGITVDHGWVYEGFGLYLTRSLVRTRMTWLAQPSSVLAPEQDMALRQRLMDPATNWMDEALRLLIEKRQPAFGEFASKNGSQLTTEDVLYAYALATYLLEAHAAEVPPMLERIGRGFARTQAFQEAIGRPLSEFERTFERWLRERS